jgi:AdoMet-dependent heme synthase
MEVEHSVSMAEPARRPIVEVDFNQTPFTVAWEVTRACAYACIHCRAEAQPRRDPRELTTDEGFRLIDQLVEVGGPILIVTGGDPMMRPDLLELIRYASGRGLRVALSPTATKLVTLERLREAKEAGVTRVQMSLDGSRPEVQDAFRGRPGSFQRTIEILDDIGKAGLSLQIGTTVSRYNVEDLPAIAKVVGEHGAVMWSLFLLVPTGRGRREDMISAAEHERVFNWLYDLSKSAPFDVRTTAAQHYRRVVIQRRRQEATPSDKGLLVTGAGYSFADGLGQSKRGVNDGNGFAFISHIGDVCPSGFLPLSGGNVRERSFVDIYRDSPLFRDLRDYGKLKGKCGICDFREVCGGSRARAYAVTGDYLESDPYCVYQPPAMRIVDAS